MSSKQKPVDSRTNVATALPRHLDDVRQELSTAGGWTCSASCKPCAGLPQRHNPMETHEAFCKFGYSSVPCALSGPPGLQQRRLHLSHHKTSLPPRHRRRRCGRLRTPFVFVCRLRAVFGEDDDANVWEFGPLCARSGLGQADAFEGKYGRLLRLAEQGGELQHGHAGTGCCHEWGVCASARVAR